MLQKGGGGGGWGVVKYGSVGVVRKEGGVGWGVGQGSRVQ